MDPLRIALLTSHRATGLERLFADPNRGVTWELSTVVDASVDFILLVDPEQELSEEIATAFAGRILTIHDDTESALLRGDTETRSSISLASGPLFLLGPRYPLAPMALDARERGDVAFLYEYAKLHRRWMQSTCWSDMLVRSLELLAGGTMQVIGDVVWIDGAPGPCRMGEAPRACHEPERGIPRSCPFIG